MKPNFLKYHLLALLCILGISTGGAEPEKGADSLPSNYVLKLKGNYQDTAALDLVLIGTGSAFQAQLLEPIRSVQASFSALPNGKFRVNYQIGASLPVTIANSTTYRETQIAGEVIVTLGKPISLIKLDDRALTLTLEKHEE